MMDVAATESAARAAGMMAREIRAGDRLLTTKLVLCVIDQDLEEKGFAGRRLSDGLQVQVPNDAVFSIFPGLTLAKGGA